MEQKRTDALLQIRNCTVISKHDNEYLLHVKPVTGRKNRYFFCPGNDFISWNSLKLRLSYTAQECVNTAIYEFEQNAERLIKGGEGYITVEYPAPDMILHLYRFDELRNTLFDVLFEFDAHSDKMLVFKTITFEHMMFIIQSHYKDLHDERSDELLYPTQQTLSTNPLYVAAKEHGDEILTALLEKYFGKYSDKSAKLPPFSEEYDREYYVITRTIPIHTILNSGYKVLHRPYFAMSGSTHELCTINPYKKSVVDAAKVDVQVITFPEFIRLLGL